MATNNAKAASVKIGADTTILYISSWNIDDAKDPIEVGVFGNENTQVLGMGPRKVTGTISGYLDLDDTTGQDVLRTAYENNTTVSGFRLYVDDTSYFYASGSDTGNGVYITSQPIGATHGEIITAEFNFSVSGDWTEG